MTRLIALLMLGCMSACATGYTVAELKTGAVLQKFEGGEEHIDHQFGGCSPRLPIYGCGNDDLGQYHCVDNARICK